MLTSSARVALRFMSTVSLEVIQLRRFAHEDGSVYNVNPKNIWEDGGRLWMQVDKYDCAMAKFVAGDALALVRPRLASLANHNGLASLMR